MSEAVEAGPSTAVSNPTKQPSEFDAALLQRVLQTQVSSLYAHVASASLISTTFALLLAIYLTPTFGAAATHTWFFSKAGFAFVRFGLARAYRHEALRSRTKLANRLLVASLLVDGAIWGVAGLGVAGASNEIVYLLIASLASVAMLATFGLQVRQQATASYVIPMLLPMTISLVWRGDAIGLFAASGTLLVLIQTLVTGYASERRMRREFLAHERTGDALLQRSAALTKLEHALEQVRRQSAIKALFLGTMSHELRTPLHGILGLTELLKQEHAEPVAKHRLELIESSGKHLLELIGALLDVSRIDAGRLELHLAPVDLEAEIRTLADLYEIRCEGKGLDFRASIRLPESSWVRGDAARIRQVLHNLLGNAVKFTQRGLIKFSAYSRAGLFTFEVTDTGPGISNNDLQHIFEAFRQVDETAVRPADGTGLGLTIARELARAMGGDIVVSSALGVGSRFTFTTVLEPLESNQIPEKALKTGRGAPRVRLTAGCRILLVEDNEVNALIAGAHLSQLGAHYLRAYDGKEAVEAAFDEPRPDLILMDCRMPVMDGAAATREIRAIERTSGLTRVPIIALTASPTDEEKHECFAAGMTGFLSKPFTLEQLSQEIGASLRQAAEARIQAHPLYEFARSLDDMEPDLFGDITVH
jgi:signal transduction histidine kinase/FixJ family two-component response regulator